MLDTSKNVPRALLPHATDAEIQAAEERFRRYLELAIEVHRFAVEGTAPVLTHSECRGNVIVGKVDPRTLINTG